MVPLIALERAHVFFDGMFSEPRLNHAETVVIDAAGDLWCGGEAGEIFRIAADGSTIRQVATTGGFILGVALAADAYLYACDLKYAAVFRVATATGQIERFTEGGPAGAMRVPNSPVVDQQRHCLYVSDSYGFGQTGPGVWRFDLSTGQGDLWYTQPLGFANGIVLTASGDAIVVAETFARRITRIPIMPDGAAGIATTVIEGFPALPDGLTIDPSGNLYIACYEPSRIYRLSPTGILDLLLDDPEAHLLCHPTSCALRGSTLFITNLGRWHITQVDISAIGV